MKRLIVGTLVSGLAVCSASAWALDFVEGTDFPNFSSFSNPLVGTLGPGAHSVTGRLSGSCGTFSCNIFGQGDTQDSFDFIVAAGTVITQLTVSAFGVSGPEGFGVTLQIVGPGNGIFVNAGRLPINGISGNLLQQAMGPGVYSASIYGQTSPQPGAYVYPYQIAFNPQLVPEPATAALMAAGALALWARRRWTAPVSAVR